MTTLTMDMSSYEIKQDDMQMESHAGLMLSLQSCQEERTRGMPADLISADAEAFIRKMRKTHARSMRIHQR